MSETPTDNPAARVLSEAIDHLTEQAEEKKADAEYHANVSANAAGQAELYLMEAAQIREALVKLEGMP